MKSKALELMEVIFKNRKIGELPDDFVKYLKDQEEMENHHIHKNGYDKFSHFRQNDVNEYVSLYSEEFMDLLIGNFYDIFEWKKK